MYNFKINKKPKKKKLVFSLKLRNSKFEFSIGKYINYLD